MKKLLMLSVITLTFSLFTVKAQKSEIKRTTHWYFGAGAGLDFSSGSPVPDTTGHLYAYEGCSTMSDTAGNLLFYNNGDTVWNKNHQPMPNGKGLLGCGNYTSSANAGLIIPKPGSNTLFYIFTTDCFGNNGVSGFRYSVVDMSLNGGLGDVTVKNYLLFAPTQEGCAATKHCNGKDFWVTSHENGTNNFRTYKIDSSGIDTVPVISTIGIIYSDYYCYLKFSFGGSRLAAANDISVTDELFDFDNTSGHLCNVINLNNKYGGAYSPCFSMDNSKLYFETGGSHVYQYNLLAGNDSVSISATRNFVGQAYLNDNSAYGALENALDGKIYISSIFEDSISTIATPNNYGVACNFSNHNIYLNGRKSELGFPLFIQNYFWDTIICKSCSESAINELKEDTQISVFPDPANSYLKIEIKYTVMQSYNIEIYNETGQLYSTKKIESPLTIINTSTFPSGIYLLKLSSFNNQFLKKVIINH